MIKYGLWLVAIHGLCALFAYVVEYELSFFLSPFLAFLFCCLVCKWNEDKIYFGKNGTLLLLIHEAALYMAYLKFTYFMWGGCEGSLDEEYMNAFLALILLCLAELVLNLIMLATHNKRS